jgi:hypothetical protein
MEASSAWRRQALLARGSLSSTRRGPADEVSRSLRRWLKVPVPPDRAGGTDPPVEGGELAIVVGVVDCDKVVVVGAGSVVVVVVMAVEDVTIAIVVVNCVVVVLGSVLGVVPGRVLEAFPTPASRTSPIR